MHNRFLTYSLQNFKNIIIHQIISKYAPLEWKLGNNSMSYIRQLETYTLYVQVYSVPLSIVIFIVIPRRANSRHRRP
jgi:hypothetical protein